MFILEVGPAGGAGQAQPPKRVDGGKPPAGTETTKKVTQGTDNFTSSSPSAKFKGLPEGTKKEIAAFLADTPVFKDQDITKEKIITRPSVLDKVLSLQAMDSSTEVMLREVSNRTEQMKKEVKRIQEGTIQLNDDLNLLNAASQKTPESIEIITRMTQLAVKSSDGKATPEELKQLKKDRATLKVALGLKKDFGLQAADQKTPESIETVMGKIINLTEKASKGEATPEDLKQLEEDKETLKATLTLMKDLGLQAIDQKTPESIGTVMGKIINLTEKASKGEATPEDLKQLEEDKETLKATLALMKDLGLQTADQKAPESIGTVIGKIINLSKKALNVKLTTEELKQLESYKEIVKTTLYLIKEVNDLFQVR